MELRMTWSARPAARHPGATAWRPTGAFRACAAGESSHCTFQRHHRAHPPWPARACPAHASTSRSMAECPALGHVAHVQHQHHGRPRRGPPAPGAGSGAGGWHRSRTPAGRAAARRGGGPVHDVTGDGFIQAVRVQACRHRQIQHAHLRPLAVCIVPSLRSTVTPRNLGHLLARTGQQVEQRRLAAIGVAQQGHAQEFTRCPWRWATRPQRSVPLLGSGLMPALT